MRYMLTTVDNPYDPYLSYDQWDAWDRQAGYNTSSLIARIAKTSEEVSEADVMFMLNVAMDEILALDVLNVYIKVPFKELPKPIKSSENT